MCCLTLLVCLVWCAAAALASSDPAELVWLLAERLEAADWATHNEETQSACTALQKLLTKQPDNKVRALAVGASVVLTRVLAVYHGQPNRRAYSAAVSAWLALTLTPDQGTRADPHNPP